MRRGGPLRVAARFPAGPRRGQIGPREPTLERALGRDGPFGCLEEQLGPDQLGPPSGVLAAEVESGLHRVGRSRVHRRVSVTRWDTRGAIATEPLEEAIDRGVRESER
jgi:hypothetical protein